MEGKCQTLKETEEGWYPVSGVPKQLAVDMKEDSP